MIDIYKSNSFGFEKREDFVPDCWINLTAPTEIELEMVINGTGANGDFLKAALDEEERSRIEKEEDQTLILVDIPKVVLEGEGYVCSTLPFGIIHMKDYIITICLSENMLSSEFINNTVKEWYTYKKSRFIMQLLYENAKGYLKYLREIDTQGDTIQAELQKSYRNKELLQMMALEKSLVYFSTSLRSNEAVLERLLRINFIRKYEEDSELLEDVIIENKQAIEMCAIYRDILSSSMETYASIISNNLNIVMKFMAAVTIVLAVPTMIASLWGMNVNVPWINYAWGFQVVVGIAFTFALIIGFWMWRRRMF